ncbi:MAG TPA: NADH-quinone oxidoreductase subunit K [Planctomycetota bacterium]|nr:NADH-quinone oxidoreductase subunit K [Planctomycetota bacterium]
MGIAIYLMTFGLVILGLYTVVAKKNVIKIIIGVLIIEYAVNLLLVLVGYRAGGQAPIQVPGETAQTFAARAVDPLPQAMVLTSIVIGLGVVALMVMMAIRLWDRYGTFDTNRIRKLRG